MKQNYGKMQSRRKDAQNTDRDAQKLQEKSKWPQKKQQEHEENAKQSETDDETLAIRHRWSDKQWDQCFVVCPGSSGQYIIVMHRYMYLNQQVNSSFKLTYN